MRCSPRWRARRALEVTHGVADLPTALRAEIGAGRGPTVAVMSEYDALPEIGHGCGHNIIASAGLGAFLALAVARRRPAGPGGAGWGPRPRRVVPARS